VIPWRLQFTGIRDYGAEEMNLANADDHILITGPNGAGKSTISFCMGAVLRSSKVDIEGLKSQNLPEDEVWRATIRFLFKNEGNSRIDAPLYIEFRLICEQAPKQPMKLHYEIHDGEEIDELALRQTYRSGDVNKNNFTAYRRDLQFKYKIHPDLYYLIWYQQEVNQFSVMAPEERFRIFSEMHGIDNIQKDWETSLEIVKEARESLTVAANQQKMYEFELSVARDKKDRFEDNERRLFENGYQYALTTYGLQLSAENERLEMEKYIEERAYELTELSEKKSEIFTDLQKENDVKGQLAQEQIEKESTHEQLEEQLEDKEGQVSKIELEVDALSSELSELKEAYSKLPFLESETKNKYAYAQGQVEQLGTKENELKEKIQQTDEEIEKNRGERSTIQATIHQWEAESKEADKLIERYTSSHRLERNLLTLDDSLRDVKEQLDSAKEKLLLNNEELVMLKSNQIESKRQQAAIRHLKTRNIKAYSLRHFVKLKDDTEIRKERYFDAIKYTIFYNASTCEPINDLYHVSLKKLVPTRAIIALPEWGLEMREGLSSDEQNQASRVLWWIEQFFIAEQPSIKNGLLIDNQGIRGPQEQDTFILSKKVLEERMIKVEQLIHTLQNDIQVNGQKLVEENNKYRVWNADVQKVKEAEAFMSTKAEQHYRIDQLAQLETFHRQLQGVKEECELEAKEVWKETYKWSEEVKVRLADLSIYEQFGQQAEKIGHLQQLELLLKNGKQEITAMRRTIKSIEDQLYSSQQQLRKTQQSIDHLEDEANQNQREMTQVSKQKSDKEEERIAMSNLAARYKEELDGLTLLIPNLVEKAMAVDEMEESKYDLQHRQNQAKVEFTTARNEKDIDSNAVENFQTLEQEVLRKKDELHAAKNLLEENEERAIQNEQRLETAIAMQVQKINLLFQQYMGLFQFEGQIQYDKSMDKKGRPVFKLFIYVRKEGHRGKLADVSLKARGGRVGKGVSGGEESLSSLLFALSLLQNLENQAGFIVLDEFDSALDETRKATVFELYAQELKRKLIILSPKAHEDTYYDQFSKAFIVSHDPKKLESKIRGIGIKKMDKIY